MTIKASGRSALILATGLFVCFAAPAPATAAGPNDTGAAKAEGATAAKSVSQNSRKRYTQRKPSKVTAKSPEADKPAGTDVADADQSAPVALPPSVANANARLGLADTPSDNANSMTARANAMLLVNADKPADVQPAAEADVVAPDQLNDVDRAVQHSQPPPQTQTVAMAPAKAVPSSPVLASSTDSSTWAETSLIGKIFVAFGALLTMASAARMFMA